jgi:DNA repair exonuclease SbcCD ATPase subunit
MIEPIMFVGIGFLVAGLLVIGVIPLVHARAVRLTMRRLEALTPLSMAEIQADKDQLRAEFAMSTRRLEMSVEQMKAKTTSQLAEIGKKSEAIGRLKLELGEKTAALFALEAKEKQLTDDLQGLQAALASKSGGLDETERTLATTQAELAQITANFHESSVTADSQRVELVALRAQTEVLKGQIETYEQETKELRDRLANKTTEVDLLIQQLGDERAKADQFGNRVGELDRQLIAQTTESEVLNRRVLELNSRLDEQGRFLADREFVSDKLRNEATTAQKTEADVRAALADAENRYRFATEAVRAEKSLVEDQLRQSQEERAKLQREIAAMKRDAENAWANERMENAVLRERINDVAAEVARLTATLEGPGSAVDTILATDAGHPVGVPSGSNGNGVPSIAPGGAEAKGTLADRIRALQGRASRVPQPSGA